VRSLPGLVILCAIAVAQDFSGTWKLKSVSTQSGALPEPPESVLEIAHHGKAVRVPPLEFTIGGDESRSKSGSRSFKTIAKWEGSALLINTIVHDPVGGYTRMDRWTLSRDRATLTVSREIVQRSGGAEVTLRYTRDAAGPGRSEPRPPPARYTIDAGTHIPLELINSVSTKQSAEGDRVYLSTVFPILAGGRVVIPPGSYVAGTLTFVKRPGRIHGRGELFLRFDSLTLPNGVTREFRARAGALDPDSGAELDRREGNIKGEGGKGADARTVGEAASTGASIGAIAAASSHRTGLGAGAGAAAGAAAGVMAVLLSRGPEIVLARGTNMELVLDRALAFNETDLATQPAVRP
jgi:type IV secretion system protein VirB10